MLFARKSSHALCVLWAPCQHRPSSFSLVYQNLFSFLKVGLYVYSNQKKKRMWTKYGEIFTRPHSAGSNRPAGHEQMLFGLLRRLLVCIVTVMISMSVATVFCLASKGNGRSHNYIITYYHEYLPFGTTSFFYSYDNFSYSSTTSLVIKMTESRCLVEVMDLLSTSGRKSWAWRACGLFYNMLYSLLWMMFLRQLMSD